MTRQLNKKIAGIPIPPRMRHLRISDRGYPVPFFVGWINGEPDFRSIDPEKMAAAVKFKKCWLCGEPLGKFLTFVIGPMCGVNRTTAEPPCHATCARYAVMACPFLTEPNMRRNAKDLPTDAVAPAGIHLDRNPGVSLLWTTQSYHRRFVGDGLLFKIGPPITPVEYFTRGRFATRAEVLASLASGMPALQSIAAKEGKEALAELAVLYDAALELLPAA
jgi:hypothetical protein